MEFQQFLAGVGVLAVIVTAISGAVYFYKRWQTRASIRAMFVRHFAPIALDRISTVERKFPFHMRADLQSAMDEYLSGVTVSRFLGVRSPQHFEALDFTTLFNDANANANGTSVIGPPQYEQIDVGDEKPVPVLQNGLWLLDRQGIRYAILYLSAMEIGSCGMEHCIKIQVATGNDELGSAVATQFFRHVETAVAAARWYRGKILSLEQEHSYLGHSGAIKVHRLGKLTRDQVILPAKTLELLDRNVIDFVASRPALGRFEMAKKKGLLFYGPPGTGKTHTVRYLAGLLEGHTTLLISAEQVALLSEYVTLARLLQPSLVVIEDVDLIARERTQMRDGRSEILLNKLLNEMDGLREDCEILFILTTNRPEDLEGALTSRPGRIDQAIEFPRPDAEGRAKLVRLYSRGLTISDSVVLELVRRTENVSASFIKELMRRAAQFHLGQNGTNELSIDEVKLALDELLFRGGSLNLKLLGAEAWNSTEVEAGE